MIPYSVSGSGDNRVLMILASAAHRYRFKQVIDGTVHDVKLRRAGSKCIAVVSATVLVYKLPRANEFHREYMQHNARAMWCGLQADPDRLISNMLEFEEQI